MSKMAKMLATILSGLLILGCMTAAGGAFAEEAEEADKAEEAARVVLPGYENTKWGVTNPDGSVASGYTWEMRWQEMQEVIKRDGIRIQISGFLVEFPDQRPIIEEGRVLVPMRPVFEHHQVQCRVEWDSASSQATVFDQSGRKVLFKPGEHSYTIIEADGKTKSYPLDAPAKIVDGRVMLPLRVLMETYEYRVDWFKDEQKAYITDYYPSWRKLLKPDEWAKALEDDCVPCALVKEAAQ